MGRRGDNVPAAAHTHRRMRHCRHLDLSCRCGKTGPGCGFAAGRASRAGTGECYTCDFTNPDFAGFVRLCGGWGAWVEHPDDLEGALVEAFSRNAPSLIDVVMDPFELGVTLHDQTSRQPHVRH